MTNNQKLFILQANTQIILCSTAIIATYLLIQTRKAMLNGNIITLGWYLVGVTILSILA